jgi:hypothetical protein
MLQKQNPIAIMLQKQKPVAIMLQKQKPHSNNVTETKILMCKEQ